LLAAFVVVIACIGVVANRNTAPPSHAHLVSTILPTADDLPIATGSGGSSAVTNELGSQASQGLAPSLPGAFASPAPASVTDQPPLKSHEVFGFAPYWTLGNSSRFDLAGLTTVDYFSVGINADGSIAESGAGWDGYESQDFIDLIDRAHAAGDRVVLTANDFSQSSLDQLSLSQTAPQTLAQSLLLLVRGRSLDGVNLDLEGAGSGDQSGITNVVKVVSSTLHAANPGYQVTMDTYASSAGDPNGFYDIPALSHDVDGFFVMAYQLNLRASTGSGSPLTSSMFSNQTTVNQYANAAPASKVILGLPFFGYDWPTSDGTLGAHAEGGPAIVTYAQEASSGHPIYWDAVTDTAWTSYQVGHQWHEAFFENPDSLYLAAQMAQSNGIDGVGIWALGMDGDNDQAMVSALDGHAPAQKDRLAGPSSTSSSPGPPSGAASSGQNLAPQRIVAPAHGSSTAPTTATAPTTRPSSVPPPPTRPLAAPKPAAPKPVLTSISSGTWNGAPTPIVPTPIVGGRRTLVGDLTGFTTNDPRLGCLSHEPSLKVFSLAGDPGDYWVIARPDLGDCAGATFTFMAPSVRSPTSTTAGAAG
jgi:hypothetical protein